MEKNIPINPTYHEVINDFAKKWEENRTEKYKEYRRKWVESPKNFIVEEAPIHLDIEVTNQCNLKCPMCPRTILVNNNNKDYQTGIMDINTFKDIIDEASEIGVYSIKLNWMGEPLIHPNIVQMVKYAKEKGIVDVMFNTNAVLLDEKISKELIEGGLDKIFFSFDSPIKENYEKIRIGARFEDTLNNIKKIIEIRKKLNKDTPLTRVSMVLMEDNKKEYKKFVDLFKDIVDVVSYGDYSDASGKEFFQEDYVDNFSCSQLWQRMTVTWNGDVLPCCGDINKEYIVGNIHNETIKKIWHSNKFGKIRELHEQGQFAKISSCRKCDMPIISKKSDGSV